MLLVVTASDDVTADYLCLRLESHGTKYLRIDTDEFASQGTVSLHNGSVRLHLGGVTFDPNSFMNVWYRRPRGIAVRRTTSPARTLHTSREWGAILDGFLAQIPRHKWVNHPAANAEAGNKVAQLVAARECGLRVPDTIVTTFIEEARRFLASHDSLAVLKPIAGGHVEDIHGDLESRIFSNLIRCSDLPHEATMARCPTLLQEAVRPGVDVRVTVVDEGIIAVAMHPPLNAPMSVDIRRHEVARVRHEVIEVPVNVRRGILSLMKRFDLRFGAFDLIRLPDESWRFLEINPNGQWAWMDLVGATDIFTLFVQAFSNDGKRTH